MRRFVTFIALIAGVSACTAAPAKTGEIESPAVLEGQIEHAFLGADSGALHELSDTIDRSLSSDPENSQLLYLSALAHYSMTAPLSFPGVTRSTWINRTTAISELDKSVSILKKIKMQPWEAEAAALQGHILGIMISLKGGGVTLGPRSRRLLNHAAAVLPNSPRVLFFRGLALLYTPARFGGDRPNGKRLLEAAQTIFASASEKRGVGPYWGRPELLSWLGLVRKEDGDPSGARAAWDQALSLDPDFAWVEFNLIPGLAPSEP